MAAGIEAEEVVVARPMRLRWILGCASAPVAKAEMARREVEVNMMPSKRVTEAKDSQGEKIEKNVW